VAKPSIAFLLLAVFAGAAAGMAVQFLAPGPETPGPAPGPSPTTATDFAEVETIARRGESRITELEIAIEELRSVIADQDEEIAGLEKKLEEYQEQAAPAGLVTAQDGSRIELPGKATAIRLGKKKPGLALLGLPEEERWAKIREDLSLDSYQEEELKRIAEDYRNSFKELFEANEDGQVVFGKLDIKKILKNKAEMEERVKNLLSEQQYETYRKGNYGAALGVGGTTSISVSTSFETDDGK
jgi:hypothetical protein